MLAVHTEFPVKGRACLLPHSLLRGMLWGEGVLKGRHTDPDSLPEQNCLTSVGFAGQTDRRLACLSQYCFESMLPQRILRMWDRKLCEGGVRVHLGYHNILLAPRRSLINV